MGTPNEEVFIGAATGNLQRLEAGLAAGGDPGAPSADGRTPLIMAARAGHVDSIRALVRAGADPAAAAGLFGTPLGHAVDEGQVEAVRALVELGVPLDPRSPEETAPLVKAAENGDADMIRYLVSAGASVDQTNRYGQTALIVSAMRGKETAAAALLELRASRDARDRVMGQTPLEHATEGGHERLVALLSGEALAAQPVKEDPAAVPAFRYAAPSGQWLEIEGIPLSEQFGYGEFVRGLLAGREPIGLRDIYPYDRLERLWNRLGEARDGFSRATAECLTDASHLVRSQALMFFQQRPLAAGAERIEELAAGPRDSFAVVDPVHKEQTLEQALLKALGARAVAGVPKAADLARRIVLEPGQAEPLLAALPDEWLWERALDIARATPAAAAYLMGRAVRQGLPWQGLAPAAAADERLAAKLEMFVDDEAMRQRIVSLVDRLRIAADAPRIEPAPAPARRPAKGAAQRIAAVLDEPPSAKRVQKLYDLGVAAFHEMNSAADTAEVAYWMARALIAAAREGHAQAWLDVGRCLWNGWGVAEDQMAALQAYQRAAAMGSAEAAYAAAFNLYWIFRRDEEAYAYVLQALAGSDPQGEAHYLAGLMAYNGRGRAKDDAESLRLHMEAGRRGNADALFELHVFHAKGVACAADPERAAEYLRRAALKDHPRACYNMGAFHATGAPGFEQDMAAAAEWYRRASAAGNGQAAATLAMMHMTGEGAAFYPARGRALLSRATDLGFDAARMAAEVGVDMAAMDAAEEWFAKVSEAIEQEDVERLRATVAGGPPVDMVSRRATTLLSIAAESGNAAAVEALIAAGASPHGVALPAMVGPDGSPLVLALRRRHFAVAERLLALGADVNNAHARHGASLTHFGRDEDADVVSWLLDHGADPERRGSDGRTPLMAAARDGQAAMVTLLLERGADPNAFKPVDFGLGVVTKDTALGMATYYKHGAIVSALKAAGATE